MFNECDPEYISGEEWMQIYIDGEPVPYMVSDHGRVYDEYKGCLKHQSYSGGYKYVIINGKKYRSHRLVMMHFQPFIVGDRNQVNHIDGVKDNNILSNLEWVDNSENQLHAFRIGLKPDMSLERGGRARLTNKIVCGVCEMLAERIPYSQIRDKYPEVSGDDISDIKHGRRWTGISDWYKIAKTPECQKGVNNPAAVHSEETVRRICELILEGYRNIDIVNMLGVNDTLVGRIRIGKRWRSISKDYF